MSKEALLKYQEYRRIMKLTAKFLQKNKEKIIDDTISIMLQNKTKLYIYDLEEESNLKKFKHDILNRHFKWIIDRCSDSTIVLEDYTSHIIPSLQPAYVDFYTLLIDSIPKNQPQQIQENLEDFFNILKDKYS